MEYPGFIGPSYQSRSLWADAEQCVNLYPETIESGNGKSKYALYPTPGLMQTNIGPSGATVIPGCVMAVKTFWNNGGGNGQMYSYAVTTGMQVNSSTRTISLYDILNNGLVATATLPNTGNPPQAAFIASNGTQLLVALKLSESFQSSALYCYNLAASPPALTAVSSWDTTQPITGLDFLDGFFVITTTSAIYCSAQGDGTNWSALEYINESDEPDGIVGMIVDHRLIWVMGKTRIEAFYNAGGVDFPFQRVPQGVMEKGCMCAATAVQIAEGIMWVGIDKGGGPVVYRSSGYTPVRVSTHAIENIMRKYLTTSDNVTVKGQSGYAGCPGSTSWAYCAARAYTYTDNGHVFYVLNFGGNNPALNAAYGYSNTADPTTTVVYDVTEGAWHERQFSPDDGNTFTRHLGNFYLYNQMIGEHVVTDYRSAVTYYMRSSVYTDGENGYTGAPGNYIWRWRTAPHIANENKWLFYRKFTLDIGINGPGQTDDTYSLYLQWSNDGGQSWGGTIQLTTTDASTSRAIWRRLGASRNRVFRVTTNMRNEFVWLNAFLEVDSGSS